MQETRPVRLGSPLFRPSLVSLSSLWGVTTGPGKQLLLSGVPGTINALSWSTRCSFWLWLFCPCLVTFATVAGSCRSSLSPRKCILFLSLPGPKVELFFRFRSVRHSWPNASTMMRYLCRGVLLDGPAWTGSMLFVDATPPQS